MSHFVKSNCGCARLIWYEKPQSITFDHPINKLTLFIMAEKKIKSVKFGKENNEDNIYCYTITYIDDTRIVKNIIDY